MVREHLKREALKKRPNLVAPLPERKEPLLCRTFHRSRIVESMVIPISMPWKYRAGFSCVIGYSPEIDHRSPLIPITVLP